MKKNITLGELVEALTERPELTVHFYEQMFEFPRTIKNIAMNDDRICIVSVEIDAEGEYSDMTGTDLLIMIEQHKKVYNTSDDAYVVLFDPETYTMHESLMLDISILDRIDINAVEM